MTRYFLSPDAEQDLDNIGAYLRTLPPIPGKQIGRALQFALRSVAQNPYRGVGQSAFTLQAGVEVRSWLCRPYRIFYTHSNSTPEIIGILHTARDIPSIMAERLQ